MLSNKVLHVPLQIVAKPVSVRLPLSAVAQTVLLLNALIAFVQATGSTVGVGVEVWEELVEVMPVLVDEKELADEGELVDVAELEEDGAEL